MVPTDATVKFPPRNPYRSRTHTRAPARAAARAAPIPAGPPPATHTSTSATTSALRERTSTVESLIGGRQYRCQLELVPGDHLAPGPVKAMRLPSDHPDVRVKLFRAVAAWLAALTVVAGLAVAAAPAAHADAGSEEALFLSLTNSLRSGLGIQTLTPQ